MKFTNKTYFALGLVASVLNLIGAAYFTIAGVNLGLIFTAASVLSGAMMFFVGGYSAGNRKKQIMLIIAGILCLFGTRIDSIGAVCGALSWPLFALWYFLETRGDESDENTIHVMATATMVCGAVQLIGSFMPMTQRIAGCLAIAFAAVQGVFVWVLFQKEKAAPTDADASDAPKTPLNKK